MNVLGINPERFSIVKDKNGEILGFGQIQSFTNPSYSEIRSMFVKEAYR